MAADNNILQELEDQAPELARLLGNTKKDAPYKIPQGYFETLTIPGLKAPVKQAPVKSIPFTSRMFKFAVAAAIIGIISVAAWFTMQPDPVKNNMIVAKNDSSLLNNINSVSDEEMEKYIAGDISILAFDPANTVADIRTEDLTLMLSEIPDSELESFLN